MLPSSHTSRRPLAAILVALLLVGLSPMAPAQGVAEDGQWIEAEFRLTFRSITDVEILGELDVRQYLDEGDAYSARDVRLAYDGSNKFGKKTGDAFVADLEQSLRVTVESTLATAFPLAVSRTVESVTIDRSTLTPVGSEEHAPPVRLSIVASIERSLDQLGLQGFSDEAVDAAFGAGAEVETTFLLTTQPGYSTRYVITPPSTLVFTSITDGDLASDGHTLTVERDNVAGQEALQIPVTALLAQPGHEAPTSAHIDNDLEMRFGEIQSGASGIPVTVRVSVAAHAIDVAQNMPDALPASVRLQFIAADGIRELHRTGAITDEQLDRAEASMLQTLQDQLEASLGGSMDITGGFVAGTVASTGPLLFEAEAVGERTFDGDAGDNLDLAFDIGAAIALDLDLFSDSGTNRYTLYAPPGITFEGVEGGTLANDGGSVTFVSTAASDAQPGSVLMRKDDAPHYEAQEASLNILVDLKDLQMSATKAIGGDYGTLLVGIEVTGLLGVLKVPEEMRASIDPRVHIEYLSSDGLRMLYDRGVLDAAQMQEIEARLLEDMARDLSRAIGSDVQVLGGFDAASLSAGLVSSPPSADTPVVFRASALVNQPLAGGEPQMQAAMALYTHTQTFELGRIEGMPTVYTIVLPKGLAMGDVQMTGGDAEKGTSDDGRDQVTITPTEDHAVATMGLIVTPAFVFAKFWGVLLIVALVLVFLVGTPIAIVMKRKKA